MDVLVSGKTSFKVEVPYKLIETGKRGKKPLIVYLHGRGQNLEMFERLMKPMLELEAYHLFIQGPYADSELTGKREKWGYMWYLYNGKQGSFLKSLEYSAEFIQEVIDHVVQFISVSRLCVVLCFSSSEAYFSLKSGLKISPMRSAARPILSW